MIDYNQYSHLFSLPWNIENHERKTWDYMKVFLNRGCVFFDIGCQKGIFSEGVLNLFQENCNVFGFDVLEHPDISELKNKFSNFYFNNFAVGNGEEVDCMICYDTNTFVEKQKTITLDNFCLEKSINKIDFIKIDVDGCELSILQGSKNTLMKHSPVVMIEMVNSEEDHKRLRIKNDNRSKCIDVLKQYGYKGIGFTNEINYFFKK